MYRVDEFIDDLCFEKAVKSVSPEAFPADVLFFDIETTGLSPSRSGLYLIGCMFVEGKNTVLRQLFADDYEDEKNILEEFSDILSEKSHIVHFNGSTFDIPYLKTKYEQHNLKDPFPGRKSSDIYRKLMPLKHVLSLKSMKQKSLEELCGIFREDKYTGGELIEVYKRYQRTILMSRASGYAMENEGEPEETRELRKMLLLHNSEDIKGMLAVSTLLSVLSFLEGEFEVGEPRVVDGSIKVTVEPSCELPSCFFEGKSPLKFLNPEGSGSFSAILPFINDSLRLFMKDFRNHYFIPSKDMAVHSSVAEFIGKNEKKRATPATCYVPCTGRFLTVNEEDLPDGLPLIKRDYTDREAFVREQDISPDVVKAAVMYKLLGSFPGKETKKNGKTKENNNNVRGQ